MIRFTLFLFSILLSLNPFAQTVYPPFSPEVDPVIQHLDSLYNSMFTRDPRFAEDALLLQSISTPEALLPHYTDAELQAKLKKIPALFPLTLTREVKACIETFAFKKRGLIARCLANSQIYFPIFEEILDRKGLPDELKYLPIVESAFNPTAISKAGATGLWQIMHGTATGLGLEINSYIDERRDPVRSTEAAADFLQKLFELYGDWQLVLAAYNSGPGNVNKAIARSGGKRTFWEIMHHLPRETRSYVPLYIAAVFVMHYHEDYKILSAKPKRDLYALDTVLVFDKISLIQVAQQTGMDYNELYALNPCYKTGIIPKSDKGYPLNLPARYLGIFEAKKANIIRDPAMTDPLFALVEEAEPKWLIHRVRGQETIGKIASRFGVSVAEIKKWNRLRSSSLQKGQKLRIQTWIKKEKYIAQNPGPAKATSTQWTIPPLSTDYSLYDNSDPNIKMEEDTIIEPENEAEAVHITAPTPTAKTHSLDPSCRCIIHTVVKGDTLTQIASRYDGLTLDKLRKDNRLPTNKPIQIGQKLKIFL